MHKYTQQEFDALPFVGVRKTCPTGDYSAISEFPAYCRFDSVCTFGLHCGFGSDCTFGSYCHFGSDCTFSSGCRFGLDCKVEGKYTLKKSNPLIQLAYAGSDKRLTTAYNTEEGIFVRCGYFFGTLTEFRAHVKETYELDVNHYLVYMGWSNLVAVQFERRDLIV